MGGFMYIDNILGLIYLQNNRSWPNSTRFGAKLFMSVPMKDNIRLQGEMIITYQIFDGSTFEVFLRFELKCWYMLLLGNPPARVSDLVGGGGFLVIFDYLNVDIWRISPDVGLIFNPFTVLTEFPSL